MKTRLTILFCTLVLIGCSYAPLRIVLDDSGRGESYAHAVAHTYEVHNTRGMGSGWAVDTDTILTNWHVVHRWAVNDVFPWWVEQGDLRWEVVSVERVPGHDAALVHVLGPPLTVPEYEARPLILGEPVIMSGNALDSIDCIPTWGHVVGQIWDGTMAIDGAIIPGMSGGPVFDEDGIVIGINVATTTGPGRALGLIIPLEDIISALDELDDSPAGGAEGGGGGSGDPSPRQWDPPIQIPVREPAQE